VLYFTLAKIAQLATLQRQYTTPQDRLEALYIDKLDGHIDQQFYEQKSLEWCHMSRGRF
jgi:hypothetical protein